MDSLNNQMVRTVVNGGGEAATSGSNKLVCSVAEEVVEISGASGANKVKAGWSELHAFPGAVSAFTAALDASVSSATLNWTVSGYDGALGAIQSGSSYRVRVASYTLPYSYYYYDANFTVSTGAPVKRNAP